MSAFTLCAAMAFIGLFHAAPSIVTIPGLFHYPYLTRLSILLQLVLLVLKVTNTDIGHFIAIPRNKYSRKYAPFKDADAALQHTNMKLAEAETTIIKNQEAHRVESFNAELQHITQMTESRQAANDKIRALNQTVQRLNKALAQRKEADAVVQSDLERAVEYSEDTDAAHQQTKAALEAEKRAHEALKQDKDTLQQSYDTLEKASEEEIKQLKAAKDQLDGKFRASDGANVTLRLRNEWLRREARILTKKNTAAQYNFDIC